MRAIGAYVVAVASAVALAIFSLIAPDVRGFESATDHSVLQRAGDLSLMGAVLYVIAFASALPLAALPFAIVLRLLRPCVSSSVAAAVAGCLGASVALLPLAVLGQMSPDDDVAFGTFYLRLLPGTLAFGLLGGLIFARVCRKAEPSRS